MQHGEREVNSRGEGEQERKEGRKRWERVAWISLGGWMSRDPRASKTNQAHPTPPPPSKRVELLKGDRPNLPP